MAFSEFDSSNCRSSMHAVRPEFEPKRLLSKLFSDLTL